LIFLKYAYRYPVFLMALVAAVLFCRGVYAQGSVDYTKVKEPGSYGSIVMKKSIGDRKGVRPVVFPHWVHRERYTCKVCHTDLGYALKAGTALIKQAEIEAGESCGACHNGKTAFGADRCVRCHSYGVEVKENARIEDVLKDLPPDDFGNKVDWVQALREGKTKPMASLDGKAEMAVLDMDVVIPVTKFATHPPDVLYPHKAHTERLDCTSCHTGIFNMAKGGNPEMNMMKIISGQYCGVCHGRVAFPLLNCFRCHSQPLPDSVDRWWDEEREEKEVEEVEEVKEKKKKRKKRRK
jgi:c(7)-type cytochrome triheme protein